MVCQAFFTWSLCQVIVGTFPFSFDVRLFLLFSDYFKETFLYCLVSFYEQNADVNAFLDAVFIASNSGI